MYSESIQSSIPRICKLIQATTRVTMCPTQVSHQELPNVGGALVPYGTIAKKVLVPLEKSTNGTVGG